jgi:predicted nucleic acid-binding protein
MIIFIDTAAFYALLDRDDSNHRKAKRIWSHVLEVENVFITSNYVLVESIALMQNRLGMEAVRGFQANILPLINIEWVDADVHNSGLNALLTSSKRRLSLVDCISFEIMRSSGIKDVFTFDSHFIEQGFTTVS